MSLGSSVSWEVEIIPSQITLDACHIPGYPCSEVEARTSLILFNSVSASSITASLIRTLGHEERKEQRIKFEADKYTDLHPSSGN